MNADWIEAENDSAALAEAKQAVDGTPYELWARNRLVERSTPEGKA